MVTVPASGPPMSGWDPKTRERWIRTAADGQAMVEWLDASHHRDVLVAGGTNGDVDCLVVATHGPENVHVRDDLDCEVIVHASRLAPYTSIDYSPCDICGATVVIPAHAYRAPAFCRAHDHGEN